MTQGAPTLDIKEREPLNLRAPGYDGPDVPLEFTAAELEAQQRYNGTQRVVLLCCEPARACGMSQCCGASQ